MLVSFFFKQISAPSIKRKHLSKFLFKKKEDFTLFHNFIIQSNNFSSSFSSSKLFEEGGNENC
jgi:hypothetical protein